MPVETSFLLTIKLFNIILLHETLQKENYASVLRNLFEYGITQIDCVKQSLYSR